MNANRLWVLSGVAAAVAIAVLGYFLGIRPQLAEVSTADQQAIQAQAQLQQTELALGALKKQYASIGELRAQVAALHQAVPGTADVTDFVRQLQSQAVATSSTVTSITVADPAPYTPQTAATSGTATGSTAPATSAATPAPTSTASPAASPAASAAPTPNATAPAVAPPLATDPSITSANFVLLPVTILATGSQSNLMAFTEQLQSTGPRLFLINSIDVRQGGATKGGSPSSAPGATASSAVPAAGGDTSTISGYIYVLVGKQTPAAG